MYPVNKGDEVPPLPHNYLTQDFVPSPKKEGGIPVLWGDRDMKVIQVAKALLESIILLTYLEEYMAVSQQNLANHYNDLKYKVNFLLYIRFLSNLLWYHLNFPLCFLANVI